MSAHSALKAAAAFSLGAAVALTAASAAQAQKKIRWKMASSYASSLDVIGPAGVKFAEDVTKMSNGAFEIKFFEPNALVPPLQVFDSVSQGSIDSAYTAAGFHAGKIPAAVFFSTVPFGPQTGEYLAWMKFGGGKEMHEEIYAQFGVKPFHGCSINAPEASGWFRKEIKSVDDLKGLKFRIAGVAGQIVAKLGAVPTQVAGGEIYQALERGTIDAAEWVGPYDDEKLGLAKVARYYYYPGWWEGSAALHLFVNKDKWNSLPDDYKAVLEAACGEATVWMMAKYDSVNPEATKRLVASGAQLRAFPRPVMEACYKVWNELTAEMSAKNEDFKKAYEHMRAFQADQVAWFRVTENTFENFMSAVRR